VKLLTKQKHKHMKNSWSKQEFNMHIFVPYVRIGHSRKLNKESNEEMKKHVATSLSFSEFTQL